MLQAKQIKANISIALDSCNRNLPSNEWDVNHLNFKLQEKVDLDSYTTSSVVTKHYGPKER
ncbi:hypothetical protein DERF_011505 [Dermatophagoides farinae]|uniref:Uncharacterized protein n=1 Tax=Dermatophagoides farinae TaxID=6954 RepID=A0A922HT27_DERFA|nr:hypothetical protein DERF_011505 [Dermatophagoides farinae]